MKIGVIGILLGGFVGVATAGDWSDYRKAFPLFPCSDGWLMCSIDGQTVGPGLSIDSQGNPIPSNMRFSFWTLETMPNASPFNALSSYTGEMDSARSQKGGTAAEPADEPRQRQAPPPAPVVEREPELDIAPPTRVSEERVVNTEREAPSVVPAAPPMEPEQEEVVAEVAPPSQPPEPVPVAPVPEPTPPEAPAAPAASSGYQPPTMAEIQAARAAAAASAGSESPPAASTPAAEPPAPAEEPPPSNDAVAVAEPPPPPPPPPEPEVVTCDDLVALESAAIMGQLGVDRRKCLEGQLVAGSKITGKDKISRVLVADAKARGDEADWERLMKRHLERIDRSDPNMCLVFAIAMHKKGVGKGTQVIRWADYAMENKSVWSGSTHTRNVYYLHKLKSQAASRLWKRAEKRFVEDRNEKNESKANEYRSMAKQFSRAWLDYAKASGKDTSQPLAACVSASGNTEFCPS